MKLKTMKALFLALVLVGLAACNTIQGIGEDVSQAGSAVRDAASETKSNL